MRFGLGQAALQLLAGALDLDGVLLELAAHLEGGVHVALEPALEGEVVERAVGRALGGLVGADHGDAPAGLGQGLEPQHDERMQGVLPVVGPDHATRRGVHAHQSLKLAAIRSAAWPSPKTSEPLDMRR